MVSDPWLEPMVGTAAYWSEEAARTHSYYQMATPPNHFGLRERSIRLNQAVVCFSEWN